MLRSALGGATSVALLPVVLVAQSYTGTFVAPNDRGGQIVLALQQTGARVTGTLTGNGATFRLEGVLEDEAVVGAVAGAPGDGLWFEAELDGGDLYLTIIGAGADGRPNYDDATTLIFSPQGAATGSQAANPLAAGGAGEADPWVGRFTDGTLVLQLTGGAGTYTGTVQAGGQAFQLRVQGEGDRLSGSFTSPDGAFPIVLQRTGGAVSAETGGTRYLLQPADGSTNPLAAAGATAPAGAASGAGGTGLDDGTALGREWAQFLAGKKATKRDSYYSNDVRGAGGYSSRTDVHLCPGGEFVIRGSSSVSVDVGGVFGNSGGKSAEQGTWRIITQGQIAGIELRYANGGVEQYRLDYQGDRTLVNGERWYITPSERCGAP
jgi:hypothetical protein